MYAMSRRSFVILPASGLRRLHRARRALFETLNGHLRLAAKAAHEMLWGAVRGAPKAGERAAEAALGRCGRQ